MSKLDEQIEEIAQLVEEGDYYKARLVSDLKALIASTIQEIMPEKRDTDSLGEYGLSTSPDFGGNREDIGYNAAVSQMEQNAKELL